jgi:glycine cleavage system H lipoate-binding protein
MQCPFLKETLVESCRHATVRKLIVRNPEMLSLERCSSPEYAQCTLYGSAPNPAPETRCPYLDESLVQYCAAAPVPKFIPFSEAVLSRCGSSAHRYCDSFITLAHPSSSTVPEVDGIAVPDWLHYAPNHMWLDVSDDGVCHLGVDAFFARSLGKVDRVTYLTTRGVHYPAVVLSAGSKDFHLTFPNPMCITAVNVYLRANPAKLASDPYRLGWLFECRAAEAHSDPRTGLYPGGEQATQWMRNEYDRLGVFAHTCASGSGGGEMAVMADGGSVAPGFVEHLDREQAARLHYAFFSPASMR